MLAPLSPVPDGDADLDTLRQIFPSHSTDALRRALERHAGEDVTAVIEDRWARAPTPTPTWPSPCCTRRPTSGRRPRAAWCPPTSAPTPRASSGSCGPSRHAALAASSSSAAAAPLSSGLAAGRRRARGSAASRGRASRPRSASWPSRCSCRAASPDRGRRSRVSSWRSFPPPRSPAAALTRPGRSTRAARRRARSRRGATRAGRAGGTTGAAAWPRASPGPRSPA